MKYADRFARVADRLRARGYVVHEQAGWRDRGHGDLTAVDCIVEHHTVDNGPADYPSLKVVRDGRQSPKLLGPLSQWGVGRKGGIYLIASGLAYHAGATLQPWQGNSRSVGIEIANSGIGEPYSPECWAAAVALTEELQREFGVPTARVLGHKEVCSPKGRKIDPSFSMNDFRGALGSAPSPSGTSISIPGGFLMALTEKQQHDLYDRVMGGIPNGAARTGQRLADDGDVVAVLRGLTAVQDAQAEPLARIMGFLVQRYAPDGSPARALDSEDGSYLVALLAGLQAAVSALATAQGVDPEAVVAAVETAVENSLRGYALTLSKAQVS